MTSVARLYCFQIDHQLAPPTLPLDGKHVWLKTGINAPLSLAELDDACGDSLHPGAKALVSTGSGMAPTDRLGATGPWTRFDGVEVFPADKSKIEAPIDLTTADTYTSGGVWSGAPVFNTAGDAVDACNGWHGGSGSMVLLGDSVRSASNASFSGAGNAACMTMTTYGLYCADP